MQKKRLNAFFFFFLLSGHGWWMLLNKQGWCSHWPAFNSGHSHCSITDMIAVLRSEMSKSEAGSLKAKTQTYVVRDQDCFTHHSPRTQVGAAWWSMRLGDTVSIWETNCLSLTFTKVPHWLISPCQEYTFSPSNHFPIWIKKKLAAPTWMMSSDWDTPVMGRFVHSSWSIKI